jgi:hypothetical protein
MLCGFGLADQGIFMHRSPIKLFSWGYWGWGNATHQWVKAVDAIETARDFNPPRFVDIRISRSVRAIGFNGNAFADLVGEERYGHMPALGNQSIVERTGKRIQIKDPAAAELLLDEALAAAKNKRRLIFFCACEYPGPGDNCHRTVVASLLLKAARRRRLALQIVEWPGGEPQSIDLAVADLAAQKLLRGGRSIPLPPKVSLTEFAGLPWGTVVRVSSPRYEFPVMAGPARYGSGKWYLPVPDATADLSVSSEVLVRYANRWRQEMGLEARNAF